MTADADVRLKAQARELPAFRAPLRSPTRQAGSWAWPK
jgi:hypothetical protein